MYKFRDEWRIEYFPDGGGGDCAAYYLDIIWRGGGGTVQAPPPSLDPTMLRYDGKLDKFLFSEIK